MKVVRNYHSPYSSTSFKTYLEGNSLSLAVMWKLTPRVGNPIGTTSHTRDITLPDHTCVFKSNQGALPTSTDLQSGQNSTGVELDAIFSDDFITEESIAAGDWNSAFFEIFVINYLAPAMGEYVVFAGFIGDIKIVGNRFRGEGRPLTSKALQQIGNLSTPKCRVKRLGDLECKVNLASPAAGDGGAITVTGTVTTGGNSDYFIDSSKTQADGYFAFGSVTFTSGLLNGRSVEVKDFSSGRFDLQIPAPLAIPVGTTYTAIRGCDQTPETCTNVYNNIVNIRAFPKVPGLEKAFRIKTAIQH